MYFVSAAQGDELKTFRLLRKRISFVHLIRPEYIDLYLPIGLFKVILKIIRTQTAQPITNVDLPSRQATY